MKRFKNIYNSLRADNAGAFRVRRILLGGVTTLGAKGVNLVLLLISVPLTYNCLGEERFGMLMTILSFVAMMSFADLGLGFGLLNRVAEHELDEDKTRLKKAISSTFFFLLGFSFFIGAVFYITFHFIDWHLFFNVHGKIAKEEAGYAMLVFSACFLFSLPFTIIRKLQGGYQESHINNYWEAAGNLTSILFLILVIKLDLGVPYIILALYGSNCLFVFLNFVNQFFYRRKVLRPSLQFFDKNEFVSIMKQGLVFFSLQSLAMVAIASDSIIIARAKGAEAVAVFAIGYKLFSVFMIPVQSFISPILPAVNAALASDDISWVKTLISKSIVVVIPISLTFGLIYLFSGNQLINYWIGGKGFLDFSLLIGFAVYIVYFNINGYISKIMLSPTFINKTIIYYGLASVVALLLKIYLIDNYNIAILLWITIASYSILFIVPSSLIIHKKLKVINGYS